MNEELKGIIQGMQDENKSLTDQNLEPRYTELDFENVISTYNKNQPVETSTEETTATNVEKTNDSQSTDVTVEPTNTESTSDDGSLDSWEIQHKKNRKKIEEDLRKQGLEDVDIIRELQNYDEEQYLKKQQTGGVDGFQKINLPEVVIPAKQPISTVLRIEDYNDKITGDDAVEKTSNWLNSYIGNRGFKANEGASEGGVSLGGEFINITAANGNKQAFNLKKTGDSYTGIREANSLEDITTWLDSQEISDEQKYVFNLTDQTPGENGLYDIKIINKKDINPTLDTESQLMLNGYKVNKDQLEVITSLVHSSIEKAITNPKSMGLSARYSSVRAGELSEDDKNEIRTAVFDRVNKATDAVINKKDFNKLFVMYDGIVQQINRENNNAKNLQVSGEELNPEFKKERLDLFVKSLTPKKKIKYALNQEIKKEEAELEKLTDVDARRVKIKEIQDLKAQIVENAKTEVPILTNDITFRAYNGKPPTVVIENPELSSMLFNNEYSVEAVEEAGELAEEFKNLSAVELAVLARSLPSTMTDPEIYQHYLDNILKIRQNTEKEFLNKEIGINMDNLDPAVRKKLLREFPQSRDFYPLKDKDFKVSIQKLYNAGFNSHKLDLPFFFGETMPDADRALYEDYEAFRLKSIAQEFSLYNITELNTDLIAIKKNITMAGSTLSGLYQAGKQSLGVPTSETEGLTNRQTLDNLRSAVDEYNSYASASGGSVMIDGDLVQLEQIKLSDEQIKAFEQSWNERIGETIGGFIPMAIELSLLSAATGGVLSFTGAARVIANMKKSKNAFDRLKGFGATVGIEEFKLQTYGFHAGDGLAFTTLGAATSGVGNLKSKYAISMLYQKTIKVGMVGATSLDVAKVTSDYIKFLNGNVDFKEEFNKYFGDSNENVQRWLTHAAAFSFHGLHNIKKTDLLGEAGKYNAIRDIEKEMRGLYTVVEMEAGSGVFQKVFGNAKFSEKQAFEKYEALLNGKLTLDQMIKEHHVLTSLDPKTNPKWKEQIEVDFGNGSDFQAKLKKENPEYEGFDIRFSENAADFYHKNNAAQYNYKGSMFEGKKQDKPYILLNPKLYKVGKIQHEALIHATVDAYFRQGGKQRKEVFIKNVSDKFKGVDFSVFIKEGKEKTREYKLAKFIEEYYSGSGSVKSEEFLGYMVEFLSKPEVYYEKVAQNGMQSLAIDMKTMLRENFNMFTNVKAKDAMELIAAVARGLEGGKFNEKSFDAFIKLLGKPKEEGGLDVISAHNELNNATTTPRGSKSEEIIALTNRKTEIIKEINNSPADKRTEADVTAIEKLRLELVEINKTLKSPEFTSTSPKGQTPLEFGNSVKNEKIVEQNTTIEKNLKENPHQEISKDPDPRKSGRGLSFDAIKLQVESISVTSKELFDKYYKDGAWTDKAKEKEWRDLENQKKGLNGLNSLKHDLIQNNQKGIDKIINQLYNKGAGVSKEDRVEKSDFKQAMMREFEKLVDSYQFKIMKDGKWIDNPTPFMGYATPAFKLRDGNAYQYLKTKELVGTKRDFDFDTLTNEDGLGGGGTKGSPVPVETLITVKDEFVVNGEKFVTEKMEKDMNASFEDFNLLYLYDYKSLTNPEQISFGTKIENKVQTIGENAMLIYNSLPQNVSPITGKAIGVQNSLLKYFYGKAERVEFKKTGDAAGNPIQNKLEMTPDQFLATLGITSRIKDGKLEYIIDKSSKDFRNVKTAINNLELQVGKIIYNQAAREYIMKNPDKFPGIAHNTTIEQVIHEIASGKDQSMASKDFADKLMEDGHVGDYNEYRDLWNSYGLLGHEDFSKSYGPELARKMGNYVRDFSAKRLEEGRVSELDATTQGIAKHIAKQEYSKGGISEMETQKEFRFDKGAQKEYMSQSNDIASEIFLGEGALKGSVRIFEGLFTSHHRTTGENNWVTNSFIKGLDKNLITKSNNTRFDAELLTRLQNIDWSTFKSPYASENYTAYKKIREASTLKEKLEIAEKTFTNKSLETSRELYDVWNTILEQYVHREAKRDKDGNIVATEKYIDGKLNPEWARKMDYVARLKKNNSTIGTQGERILAPEGYIFIPTGKYSKGIDNPDYQGYYDAQVKRLTGLNSKIKKGSKKWLSPKQIKERAEKLALAETGDKVEHFMSSNERGVSSLMLMENNQFHKRGKENMENYVGIWGQKGAFNLIDKAGGEINTSGVFRFAYNVELAKSTYSIESIKAGKPKTIYQEMIEKTGEASVNEIMLEAKRQNNENVAILKKNGIEVSLNPFENIVKIQELNNTANKELVTASKDIELSNEFNSMMEGNYNIKKEATYSPAKAKVISERRSWYKGISKEIFVGSRADDFKGLTNYRLVNKKGKEGEAQQKFYDDNLHIPYALGVNALNVAKNKIETEYKALNSNFPNIKKILKKDVPGEIFSNSNAARVYLWTKSGIDMREFGLSAKDIKKLNDAVINNPELQAYADQLGLLTGTKGNYVKPDAFWLTQGIQQDLMGVTSGKNRDNYLIEFNANVDAIFSPTNLNKIEVIHGPKYREALENSIYRMKTGSNRVFSKTDKIMNEFNDWTNGAVGVTMFLNTRSAALQLQSTVNYMDMGANNPINAAKTLANPKQYMGDFGIIYNHPQMKQRRGGLGNDVNASELVDLFNKSKGNVKGWIAGGLQKGYFLTKTADSVAIGLGAASYLRNHLNARLKQAGIPSVAVKYNNKTFEFEYIGGKNKDLNSALVKSISKDVFQQTWERTATTQQSADPSKISQVQASGLGRLVFAFQNTPMQYTREMKKSVLDLTAGRGNTKHNISKILYYGAAQNLIFGALQNALFTSVFDDDEDAFDTKTQRTLNGMFDTVLRGSGLPGAILSTTKNVFMKFAAEEKKGFNADHAQTLIQAANFAPPIGIKARKLYSSMKGYQINKNVIPHMGYSINNPAWEIAGSFTAATTNIPLDRIVQKSNNIREILTGDHKWWQNTSLAAGYRPYDVGIVDAEKEEAKGLVKLEKKIEADKKKAKKKQEQKKLEDEERLEKQKQEIKEGKKEITCSKCNRKALPGKKVCTVHEVKEQRKDGVKKRCIAKKTDGTQCKEMTANKSGECYYHD